MYSDFLKELKKHPADGYHVQHVVYNKNDVVRLFTSLAWEAPDEYVNFLSEVGAGIFFAGNLVIFPTEEIQQAAYNVLETTKKLDAHQFFAFGYDGSTEGVYCLEKTQKKASVYWYYWHSSEVIQLDKSFKKWIIKEKNRLFNPDVYAGYKKIKHYKKIREVTEERKKFAVKLVEYDCRLSFNPEKEGDVLPRYHRVLLDITKLGETWLKELTIKVYRDGSSIGKDNTVCLTLDVSKLSTGSCQRVEAFVFDPFAVPFKSIELHHSPLIDLNTPIRTAFKEILPYL